MENNDYKQLVEFMERTFTKFDNRLESMQKRLENTASKDDLKGFATKDDLKPFATKDDLDRGLDDVKRHNEILIEDVKHGLQAIDDGMRMHDEKNDRDKAEFMAKMGRMERSELHLIADIDDHDRRIKALEKKL